MSKNKIVHSCFECPLCHHVHEGVEMKTICSETGSNVENNYDKIAKNCPFQKDVKNNRL